MKMRLLGGLGIVFSLIAAWPSTESNTLHLVIQNNKKGLILEKIKRCRKRAGVKLPQLAKADDKTRKLRI